MQYGYCSWCVSREQPLQEGANWVKYSWSTINVFSLVSAIFFAINIYTFYNVIINFLCKSFVITFCLSSSSHMLIISFLMPVFPATLLAISRSNRSINACGLLGMTVVPTPWPMNGQTPEYTMSHIGIIISLHFCYLLDFSLFDLGSWLCFIALVWRKISA